MCSVWVMVQQNTRWALGEGRIDFWDDIWIGNSTLRDSCPPHVVLTPRLVKDFWRQGEWDPLRLHSALEENGAPIQLVEEIMSIPFDDTTPDIPRWELTGNRNFTVASAWEEVRHGGTQYRVFEMIWNKGITPTISVFLWRLLSNRIPVDVKLQWRNISLASRCRCCRKGNVESAQHLFIHGETAVKVWRYYGEWFTQPVHGRRTDETIADRLGIWGGADPNIKKCHISRLIPCLILWFLWTERNSCIHRGTSFSYPHVVGNVNMHLQSLVITKVINEEHWRGCRPKVRFMSHITQRSRVPPVTLIRWARPEPPWLKLNTDGAFDPVSRRAGGGGLVRDHMGNLITAFSIPVTAQSAFEAELLALKQGLNLKEIVGRRIWVELDAEYLVEMLNSNQGGPVYLRHDMQDVKLKLASGENKVTHLAREGNKAADFLAQMGSNEAALHIFDCNTAPPRLKALVALDRDGLPNFRFRSRND